MKCNKNLAPKGQPINRCGKESGKYIYCKACEDNATYQVKDGKVTHISQLDK